MLQNVLQTINNFFVKDFCTLTQIELDGCIVTNPSMFIKNQYVLILNSNINDGVYKITSITGNKLFLDLEYDMEEESTDEMIICALAIPKAILDITNEIIAYNDKHSDNVASESLGDYSVSYGNSNGDVSWLSAFRNKLAPYKKTYLSLPMKYNLYDFRY